MGGEGSREKLQVTPQMRGRKNKRKSKPREKIRALKVEVMAKAKRSDKPTDGDPTPESFQF